MQRALRAEEFNGSRPCSICTPHDRQVLRLTNLGMLPLTGCALMRVIYTLFKSLPPRLAYTEFKMLRRAAY